jgi:hypothetical protein
MINITKYDNLVSQNFGILKDYFETEISFGDFKVEKYSDKGRRDGVILYGLDYSTGINSFVPYVTDDLNTIKIFYDELFKKDFNSVLIAGLGLGVIPYILKDECQIIDVVEKDNNLISTIQDYNYISGTTIINEDIFVYEPNKNYDLILLDIWCNNNGQTIQSEISTLVTKFLPFLNQNGIIYIPINKINGQTIWY